MRPPVAAARRVLTLVGLGLVVGAALWYFWLAPRWAQRIPPGWTWKADFIGVMTYADPKTRAVPEKDTTSVYQRRIRVLSETGRPRHVLLEDAYVVRDPLTGGKTWEYIYRASVDPGTGAHLTPAYSGSYFVFPSHVEKKTYAIRFNYVKGIPMSFEREEEVADLTTYLFSYRGRAEYTEAYGGTREFEGIKVEPGQEIRCVDDQFVFKAWVEPITGEIVKMEESCYASDAVFDVATGRLVYPVARWGGVTAGDDVILRADATRGRRDRYLWMGTYAPAAAAVSGLLFTALGMAPRRPVERGRGAARAEAS